jgi:hypothetical protein
MLTQLPRTASWPLIQNRLELNLKVKNILAATAITAWSGMACAGFVTTFGQNSNLVSPNVPMTFYPEVANARDTFIGAGSPSFFDFESSTLGSIDPSLGGTPLAATLGGVGITISGAAAVASNATNVTKSGRYSVSGVSDDDTSDAFVPAQGNRFIEATAKASGSSSFQLVFDRAVQSFGFFATDIGDFGGLLTLELTLAGGGTRLILPGGFDPDGAPAPSDRASGSVLFFGVSTSLASEYFTAVRFLSTGGTQDDVFGFDMFTLVAAPGGPNPTPLPGSLVLVGAALGGLALVRRRR